MPHYLWFKHGEYIDKARCAIITLQGVTLVSHAKRGSKDGIQTLCYKYLYTLMTN